jgi:hypothetical protein
LKNGRDLRMTPKMRGMGVHSLLFPRFRIKLSID